MDKFAQIVLAKSSPFTDKIYDYTVPPSLKSKIQIGSQVVVPFGKRRDIGYVIGFTDKSEIKGLKDIIELNSPHPFFNEDSLSLAKWLSDYYYSFFMNALRTVMPPGTQRDEGRRMPDAGKGKRGKGCGKREEARAGAPIKIGEPLKPTPDQKKALDLIFPSIENKKAETILLYGITGSGKTEVYLQAAAHALSQGKSSIILVPEVALTDHLIERFKERFTDHLAVLHSEMTIKERRENWLKVSNGKSKIILGTRSALFSPAQNLGLIVLDEEYETTYKQEQNPRYHAREVAEFLSKRTGATVVLGSATPSIETFYKAENGEYLKASLPQRIDGRPLPPVRVIDMKKELEGGNRGLLSRELKEKIKETLSAGQQVILFLNRRGFFTFVLCRECGFAIKCPKCSVSLSFHMSDKKLKCSHCNFSAASPIICPNCRSSSVGYLGVGTQRIEQEVGQVFPEAKIIRIDRDTVGKRGSFEGLFRAFREGKANVLIGTQLVTKGLDVAAVTLVGVVSADTALNLPDFRAGEHTFQLLTQVAGRAGRHNLPGNVIIQTYNPDHYVIKYASAQDYDGFYREEIENRMAHNYPPFCRIINIIISGPDEKKVSEVAGNLQKFIKKRLEEGEDVLGPTEAAIRKLRGSIRHQIVVKGKDISSIRKAVVEAAGKVVLLPKVRINVDIDPMNML